jgi:hypothetical protein
MAVIGELGCTFTADAHHENNVAIRYMTKKGLPVNYMPPEIIYSIRNRMPLYVSAPNIHTWDSFSFSISLFEVILRSTAWPNMNRASVEQAICDGMRPILGNNYKNDETFMKEFEHIRGVIAKCWNHDALQRPNMVTLVKEFQPYHELHYQNDEAN